MNAKQILGLFTELPRMTSRNYVASILDSPAPIPVEVSPDRVRRMPASKHLATRLDRYSLNLIHEISAIQISGFHETTELRFRVLLGGDTEGVRFERAANAVGG
jgi:hypothetical protein